MTEMTALEYFKEKASMTNNCEIACPDCMLSIWNNGTRGSCRYFEYRHPEQAIAIVQKWAQEHPRKMMWRNEHGSF